ncbi:MAG TPA: hypothetical protein ENN81_02655, partial [Phycisphaerales bacterium]|nr:hypothetical protein [Phycisphaerales bacterium]
MKQAIIVVACLTLSQVAWGRHEALANEGKRGLAVRYVDHALQLKSEEVDLGNAALLVSEEWSHLVDRRRYLDRLDAMARDIRTELAGRRMGIDHRAIGVINEYLFGDEKFKPVASASDPNDLFLDTVLDKKRGYCLSL